MTVVLDPGGAAPAVATPVPGPKGLPLLGNILDFGRDQIGFLERHTRTYGDLVRVDFAGWPTVLVHDMEAIEHVLVGNPGNFIKNRAVWRHVTALFGQGLLTSEGEFWQRQRRLAAPPFAPRQLLAYDADMVAIAADVASRWHDGQVLDIHPQMMNMSLRVAAKTLFDSDVRQDIELMDSVLDDLAVALEARFKRPFVIPDAIPLPSNRRYNRAIRAVESVVARLIQERRRNGVAGRNDFLSRLMAARDADGTQMTDALLRDEAITLLLAGHETTALALSWTFHLLGSHPEIQDRLIAEVDAVLGGRAATSSDLAALTYAEAVVTEAMRIFPPSWVIGRESVAPFTICGRQFDAGTTVLISQWVLHRDPRWFEDPLAFRPERWLDEAHRKLPRFAYMPFGGGPRICIGHRFAMIEAVLMLATLMQRFSVEWQADRPIEPFPSITLRPGGGVWVRLSARQPGERLQ